MSILPTKQHLNAALRQYPAAFTTKVFHTLNPGQTYQYSWHIEQMVNELESCRTGGAKRLIINLPPRSLKLICVSVALPAFILGHDPGAQIICVRYSTDLALKHDRDFRKVVESDWYRARQCRRPATSSALAAYRVGATLCRPDY